MANRAITYLHGRHSRHLQRGAAANAVWPARMGFSGTHSLPGSAGQGADRAGARRAQAPGRRHRCRGARVRDDPRAVFS